MSLSDATQEKLQNAFDAFLENKNSDAYIEITNEGYSLLISTGLSDGFASYFDDKREQTAEEALSEIRDDLRYDKRRFESQNRYPNRGWQGDEWDKMRASVSKAYDDAIDACNAVHKSLSEGISFEQQDAEHEKAYASACKKVCQMMNHGADATDADALFEIGLDEPYLFIRLADNPSNQIDIELPRNASVPELLDVVSDYAEHMWFDTPGAPYSLTVSNCEDFIKGTAYAEDCTKKFRDLAHAVNSYENLQNKNAYKELKEAWHQEAVEKEMNKIRDSLSHLMGEHGLSAKDVRKGLKTTFEKVAAQYDSKQKGASK